MTIMTTMTTNTLPLTTKSLSALPTAPSNLTVLDYVAQQRNVVHPLRSPSLSPMHRTQDRLFELDSLQEQRSRSASLHLPATPPSPSASRRARRLTSSPVLQHRQPSNSRSIRSKPTSLHGIQEEDLQLSRPAPPHQSKRRSCVRDKADRAMTPNTFDLNAAEEAAERLTLRRSKRRQKALIVKDRSKSTSARLRSDATKSRKLANEQDKENNIDSISLKRTVVKENKNLRKAVLAMEAYKPVGRLGSGKMTTGGKGLNRGLFSKGAASPPVRVNGRSDAGPISFCEASFLQTNKVRPQSDTDTHSNEESKIDPSPSRRKRCMKQHEKLREPNSGQTKPQRKRSSLQIDDSSLSDSPFSSPQSSCISKDGRATLHQVRGSERLKEARKHYGRRRKRTLLASRTDNEVATTSPEKRDAEGTAGTISPQVKEHSRIERGEEHLLNGSGAIRRDTKQKKRQQETQAGGRARRNPTENLPQNTQHAAETSRPSRGVISQDVPASQNEISNKAVQESVETKPPCRRANRLTQEDEKSDESIYLKVRISSAPSRRRKLTCSAVGEQEAWNALELNDHITSPKEGGSDITAATSQVESKTSSRPHKTPSPLLSTDHAISDWKGSAWISASPKLPQHRHSPHSEETVKRPPNHNPLQGNDPHSHADFPTGCRGQTKQDVNYDRSPWRPLPIPSRLDWEGQANGWRLQHTRPQEEPTHSSDFALGRDLFPRHGIEQAAILDQEYNMNSADLADLQSPHQVQAPLRAGPYHSDSLCAPNLQELPLADCSVFVPNSDQVGRNSTHFDVQVGEIKASEEDGTVFADDRFDGDDKNVGICETPNDGPRSKTAAEGSTVYTGRATWAELKAAVDRNSRSFSSEGPITSLYSEHSEEHPEGLWPPRAATPYSRIPRHRLSQMSLMADDWGGEIETSSDIKLRTHSSFMCNLEGAQPSDKLVLQENSQTYPYCLDRNTDVSLARHDSNFSGVVGPVQRPTPQRLSLSDGTEDISPCEEGATALEPLLMPQRLASDASRNYFSATGSCHSGADVQLQQRTNSRSSYSNSSFDDLDFLSVRPGPGRDRRIVSECISRCRIANSHGVPSGNAERRVQSTPSVQLSEHCRRHRFRNCSGGTDTRNETFWSKQEALVIQQDASQLCRRRSCTKSGLEGTVGPLGDDITGVNANRGASSSLDPLDLDWTG